jgi:hypothetical protein
MCLAQAMATPVLTLGAKVLLDKLWIRGNLEILHAS